VIGFGFGWHSAMTDDLHQLLLKKDSGCRRGIMDIQQFLRSDLAVLPEYQGKGVGKEIYSALFGGLSQKTCDW
jgi:GNAT superfamily N-acetyltransferase